VKITGAITHEPLVPESNTSNESVYPDPCTSLKKEDIPPTDVSSLLDMDGNLEPLALSEDLDFDEFLLDAAEWL
jgi:hypothetical protein